MIHDTSGFLVVFEGIDGAGKSTQVTLLASALEAKGHEVVTTREPTSGVWGQKIRRSKLEGRLTPDDEYEAFLEDRREHVRELVLPALQRGAVVLIDRYYFSTMAYQGAAGYAEPEVIRADNEAFAPEPDVLVLMELAPEESLKRITQRDGAPDEFETMETLSRCAKIFHTLVDDYILRLDATRPPSELFDVISAHVFFLLDLGHSPI
ncbi:MAG: dTMP kinase [Myxococcota bacterium]